jgi:short-subunit dehydrogenase
MMDTKPSVALSSEKYGPWAVIAGGSEGIGACIAHQLAKSGINLVLVARKVEPLEIVAASVRARTSAEVRILALDLTDASTARVKQCLPTISARGWRRAGKAGSY